MTINKIVNIALPQATTFNFTISCTHPTAGVIPIAAADANPSIAMASGATTGSVTVNSITAGSTCSVTETAPAAIPNYTWGATPGPNSGITTSNGTTATTSFTNTLSANPGTLTVTKTIIGPAGSPSVTGSFPFTVACQTPTVTYSGNVVVSAGNSGTGTVSIPASSTSCVVSETVASLPAAPAGYTWAAPTYTQPSATALPAGGNITGTMVNPLQSGSLTINKTVSMALPQAATFNFTLSCTPPTTTPATTALGASNTSQSIAMASGATTGSITVSPIAAGSTCSVTETAPAAIPNYTWGATPGPNAGIAIADGTTATTAFTNTLTPNPGTMTVTKTITGPAGSPSVTGSFPFTVTCQTPTASYNGAVVVSAGNSGSSTVAIAGGSSSCVISETVANRPAAPAGYAWAAPTYTQPSASALPGAGNVTGVIANALQSGSLTINKTVTMALPQAATFNFTVSCTAPTTTPATTALGASVNTSQSIAMASGATTGSIMLSPIAAGSTCSVSEAAPAAITNYAWGTTPAAVAGVVVNDGANANAGFINVLTPLDPPFISKRARVIDGTTIEWTITVVNNSTANASQGPVAFTVIDALPAGVTYAAGTLSCTPTGTAAQTSVATCGFNSGNTSLAVSGTLAYTPDTTAASARERVDIVFRGTVAQGDMVLNTACTRLTGQAPIRCDSSLGNTPAAPVPSLDVSLLGMLMLLLASMGLVASRGRKSGTLKRINTPTASSGKR